MLRHFWEVLEEHVATHALHAGPVDIIWDKRPNRAAQSFCASVLADACVVALSFD